MIQNIVPLSEWERSRMGAITSSELSCLFVEGTRTMTQEELDSRERGPRGGLLDKRTTVSSHSVLSKGAKTYLMEKFTELLTGTVRVFENHATQWGDEMEEHAIEMLKVQYPELKYFGGNEKWLCKFIGNSGGSPDFTDYGNMLVGEIKCPENPSNHVEHLLLETEQDLFEHNKDYYYQIQANMLFVSHNWGVDFEKMNGLFCSYGHVLFDENIRLKTITLKPNIEFAKILVDIKLPMAFDYMRKLRDQLI